jgi:hypothetical protein
VETIRITLNAAGKVRRETRGGKEFLVAPMSLLREAVLEGSAGAVFYPDDEIKKNPSIWDGLPIVVDHPTLNGLPVSARDPDVMGLREVGRTYRTKHDGKRLLSEGWFEIDALKRVDNRVHDWLIAGKQIELSTGLMLIKEPAPEGAVHNGKPYRYIGRSYFGDHVAVLPSATGACSIADGCGVLVNKRAKQTRRHMLQGIVKMLQGIVKMPWPGRKPKKVEEEKPAETALALPEGGVAAIAANETSQEQHATADVPAASKSQTEGATMNRQATVEWLVANCECWKDGKAELEKLSDAYLARLKDGAEKVAAEKATLAANAAKPEVPATQTPVPATPEPAPITRQEHEALVNSIGALTTVVTTMNASMQAITQERTAQQEATKAAMIDMLTANAQEPHKAALTTLYQGMTHEQLGVLIANQQPQAMVNFQRPVLTPNYSGAAGGVTNTRREQPTESLPVMEIDYEELSRSNGRSRAGR